MAWPNPTQPALCGKASRNSSRSGEDGPRLSSRLPRRRQIPITRRDRLEEFRPFLMFSYKRHREGRAPCHLPARRRMPPFRPREPLGQLSDHVSDVCDDGLAGKRCGVRGEVIARILNHTLLGSPVTQIYNRYDYAAEKRAALELWAATLLKITTAGQGTPPPPQARSKTRAGGLASPKVNRGRLWP